MSLFFVAPDCEKYPACTTNHQDKLFVCNPGAHCIKVFDKTGVLLHDIGCIVTNDKQFICPVGLVTDKYRQLIVCDVNDRRLQLFTLRGTFLSKLRKEYLNVGNPWYDAMRNNDDLFVADPWGGCIFVFH